MERGNKDRRNRGDVDTQISKALSRILRHSAVQEGLTVEPSGYIPLDQVMQALKRKGLKQITEQKIDQIVNNNDKKRFQIEERKHHKFIRATQGHTMKEVVTEQLLTKIVDPSLYPVVVHGTFSKFWGPIKGQGLKRMGRNHIHFAPGMPKEEGVISGMRSSCDIIIEIDMEAAMKDGIQFFISSNNVILTEGDQGVLRPMYFKRVTNKKTGMLIEGKLQQQIKPEKNNEIKHQTNNKKQEHEKPQQYEKANLEVKPQKAKISEEKEEKQ